MDIKIGYLIIATFYMILAIAKLDFSKVDFWVYGGLALTYMAIADNLTPFGIKLD